MTIQLLKFDSSRVSESAEQRKNTGQSLLKQSFQNP